MSDSAASKGRKLRCHVNLYSGCFFVMFKILTVLTTPVLWEKMTLWTLMGWTCWNHLDLVGGSQMSWFLFQVRGSDQGKNSLCIKGASILWANLGIFVDRNPKTRLWNLWHFVADCLWSLLNTSTRLCLKHPLFYTISPQSLKNPHDFLGASQSAPGPTHPVFFLHF